MSALDEINLNGTRYNLAVPTAEMTQTAVNEWLDEHPEATTTVEDGSLSLNKLTDNALRKIERIYSNVAAMVADTSLTSGTVKTAGYYTADDGYGCIYRIVQSGYEHTCFERLLNGYYAVAMFALTTDNNKPTGDVSGLVNTALTYQGSGKTWVYAVDSQGASHPTAVDEDYVPFTYYIDCSTLFALIASGISYENSAYNRNDNTPTQGAYIFPSFHPTFFEKIRAAYQQAMFFSWKGAAYLPNSDHSNIRIGDAVFFSGGDYDERRFMNIDHVAIYMGECGVDSNGNKQYQFIGNDGGQGTNVNTFFYVGSQTYMDNIVLCAGFAKQPCNTCRYGNMLNDNGDAITVTNSDPIIYLTKRALKSYKAYTIKIKVSASDTYSCRVSVPNHTIYADGYSKQVVRSDGSVLLFHFVTGDLSDNAVSNNSLFRLSIAAADTSILPVVDGVVLCEGWLQDEDIEGYVGRITASFTLSAASGTLQLRDGNLYADIAFSPAQTGNHTLGNFGTIIPKEAEGIRYYPCVLSDNSLALLRVSNGTIALLTTASQYTSCKSLF